MLKQGLFGLPYLHRRILKYKSDFPCHTHDFLWRGVGVTILGVWLFQDIISTYVFSLLLGAVYEGFLRSCSASIITILKGSIYYTWVKNEGAN